jgi:hypothetical protein
MKASDNFTVQALIVALSQIEQPLDSHIQSELNQISADWKNNSDWQEDIDAIKQIRRVVYQYPVLQVPYDAALDELYDNYQTPQFSMEANIDNDFQPFDWLTAVKMVLGSAESVSTAIAFKHTAEVYDRAVDVLEKAENTSVPYRGENQSYDRIELRSNDLTPSSRIQLIFPGRCTPHPLSLTSGKNFSDEDILSRQELRDYYASTSSPNSFQSRYENPFVTPSDCYSCKYFSGDQLLKCAVNPKRMMDDDCAEFERSE